ALARVLGGQPLALFTGGPLPLGPAPRRANPRERARGSKRPATHARASGPRARREPGNAALLRLQLADRRAAAWDRPAARLAGGPMKVRGLGLGALGMPGIDAEGGDLLLLWAALHFDLPQ